MKVSKERLLFDKMKQGQVYRRSDLAQFSSSVDRHLDRLVRESKVIKVSGGLYMRPKVSAFGDVPPDERTLLKTFLKDDRFLVNSFSRYTQLGLGLTQFYQHKVVYNYKRFGEFELGGQKYFFKRLPQFPRELTKEYLLVDMLNNLKDLVEDESAVIAQLSRNKENFDASKVFAFAKKYGRPRTKKILAGVYQS